MTTTPVEIGECRIAPPVLIDPIPCTTTRKYGLYSVASPLPMPKHGDAGGVEWLPDVCDPTLVESYCPGCAFPGDSKTFYGPPDLRSAAPFAVYGSFTCSGPGFGPEEAQRRAAKNLEVGEEYRVEYELSFSLQDPANVIDLTPASGAPSFLAGLVALETWGSKQLACSPTIHLRGGTALAAPQGSLLYGPTQIRTQLGSLVSAPHGWDTRGIDGTPPPPGEYWLWATGPVRIWRGDIFEPTAEAAASVNRENNDVSALAERTIVLGYECGAAAIRVSIP